MTREQVGQIVVSNGRTQWRERELGELAPGYVRVRTHFSGVSQGTELLAHQLYTAPGGPDHPLGYQLAGEVIAVGTGVGNEYNVSDRVACYGAPYVSHAHVVDVPHLLVARVPHTLPLEHAAFCGAGAIALHAFRCAKLSLGDITAVIGLGVLGNLTAQFARLAGCRVIATDLIPLRTAIARECSLTVTDNFDALSEAVQAMSDGHGADAVFLAVNRCDAVLLERAVELVRIRGHVVIVGMADAPLPREALFAREAQLIVSRAGGPGRYDSSYEAQGMDYPYGYVRWTEGRNLREFVRLAAEHALVMKPLVTDVVPVTDFSRVYEDLAREPDMHVGVAFNWQGVFH